MKATAEASFADLIAAWPVPWPAVTQGRYRSTPEDFIVHEQPLERPAGSGESVWLEVEKRSANTRHVADQLARYAGVPSSAVSWAGRKDRHAVTRQWFSVHLPGREAPDWSHFETREWRVLAQARHPRKLRIGQLAGNRFQLRLRAVDGDRTAIEQRLALIGEQGVPNYFGPQRFGREGSNLQQAMRLDPRDRRNREQRSLALSAARAFLFNEVLAQRVVAGNWNRPIDGEARLAAARKGAAETRCAGQLGQTEPTGPLWGRGRPPSSGESAMLESAIAQRWPQLAETLEHVGLVQERRLLRLRPADWAWSWPEAGGLELRFELPPGAFATAILRCLGPIVDAQAPQTP